MPAPYGDDEQSRGVGIRDLVAAILIVAIAFLRISTWLLFKDIHNERAICHC